jgi:DNA polymerase III subunit gamma/tau
MAFQSLYRRYRPQRFDQIKGQDHVVRALRNAAAEDRLGHAYLFSGPRGTGKTSTARILAKVLNCEAPVDGEPCGECPPCQAIEAGTSFDVTELDAASNRGIEDIRSVVASTALASPGRTRLYILDEVHMLTPPAAAALLKTLEEPPSHVVFVLATTDPEKVLPTIRSRTQHLEFRLLPAAELEAHVRGVLEDAGLEVDDEGVTQAIREGGGSPRDTLSALDRIVAAGGVARTDGSVDAVIDALSERDGAGVLVALADAANQGRDARLVGEQLLARLRNAFLASMRVDLTHLNEHDRQQAEADAERMRPAAITRALEAIGVALVDMRQAPDPRIPLEVALVRIARPESDPSAEALLERIEALEAVLAGASPASLRGAASAPPEATPRPASPAAEARERLAEAKRPEPTPAPPPPDEQAMAEAEPPPEPDPAPAGDLPSRDELTLDWPGVLEGLRPKHKALFAAGRFVEADGLVQFALPNSTHVARCEDHRSEVEAALAAHYGRPVPLLLVVDPGTTAPPPTPAAEVEAAAEDIGPVDDLEDAGDVRSGLDQVTEVFGKVELIEKEERQA